MVPAPTDNGLIAYFTSSICNSSRGERLVLLEMTAS
jgi:hypothetical protein